MVPFVGRRLIQSVPLVLVVTLLVFVVVHACGDPLATLEASPGTSEATLRRIVEQNRLDEPVLVQYGYWLWGLVTDGFGTTLVSERTIWPDLRRSLANSAQLILPALVLGTAGGVIVGTACAVRRRSVLDRSTTAFTFVLLSTPEFWLALMLQVVFTNVYVATGVRIFYTSGLGSRAGPGGVLDRLRHLALPVLVLGLVVLVIVTRYVRAAVSALLETTHVRTARAKGLDRRAVLFRHVLRNALPPVIALVATSLPLLFGGAVVVETVFSIDGFGRYVLRALEARDVYPVMAGLVATAVLTVAATAVADVVHAVLDPRVGTG